MEDHTKIHSRAAQESLQDWPSAFLERQWTPALTWLCTSALESLDIAHSMCSFRLLLITLQSDIDKEMHLIDVSEGPQSSITLLCVAVWRAGYTYTPQNVTTSHYRKITWGHLNATILHLELSQCRPYFKLPLLDVSSCLLRYTTMRAEQCVVNRSESMVKNNGKGKCVKSMVNCCSSWWFFYMGLLNPRWPSTVSASWKPSKARLCRSSDTGNVWTGTGAWRGSSLLF